MRQEPSTAGTGSTSASRTVHDSAPFGISTRRTRIATSHQGAPPAP